MLTFKEYLSEALITFGPRPYPASGHVVIMAGGAGSGKGFIKSRLLGIEGYNFDVDELKLLVTKTPQIISKYKAKYNFDLSTLNPHKTPGALKSPSNTEKLHHIVSDVLGTDNKRKQALFSNIIGSPGNQKPNIIFDITMRTIDQMHKYTLPMQNMGYLAKNIHVVWVVNDIRIAIDQNASRDRVVPDHILIDTHKGASETLYQIVNQGRQITKFFDGALVLCFNKVGVDMSLQQRHKSDARAQTPKIFGGKYKGGWIEKANYVYLKHPGQPIDTSKLSKELRGKIGSYVPNNVDWSS